MSRKKGSRASLYVRLSRAADDSNLSKEGMIRDVRALAESEGLTEVALHVDDGKSGGYRDRPEFLAWIADAREGRADVLIAWHVDRMTREGINVAADLLDLVEGKDPRTGREVAARRVRLMDTRGLDSNDGDSFRWRFVIAAEVARAERERMRDRARARTERARREGRWSGGSTPYGYRSVQRTDGPGFTLEPDPKEAAIVRGAADEVLAGASVLSVVRRLNTDGVPPRYKGKRWTRAGLVSVLTGEAVRGHMTIAVQRDPETGRRIGREVLRDESGLAVKVWDPILSDVESEELRRALATKAPRGTRPGRYAERLLSGIVHCARCGGRMRVRHVRRTRRRGEENADRPSVPVYECVTYQTGGRCGDGKTGGPTVRADWLEDYVAEAFLQRFGWLPVYEQRVSPGADAERLARVNEAIGAVAAELATRADAGAFARLAELQAERDALAAAPAAPTIEYLPMHPPTTVAAYWPSASLRERQAMLASYLQAVDILPTGRRGGPWRYRLDPERVDLVPRPDQPSMDDMGHGNSPGPRGAGSPDLP
jgi:DNA invertase Pin-like site-specific DNA recombinase